MESIPPTNYVKENFYLFLGHCVLFLKEKAALSWRLMGLGLGSVTALFLTYLHFDFLDIGRDLTVAGHARSHSYHLWNIFSDLVLIRWQILIGGILAVASSHLYLRPPRDNLILFGAFFACSFAVFETNSPLGEVDELPLFPVLLILLSVSKDYLLPANPSQQVDPDIKQNRRIWLAMVLIALNFYCLADAASITYAASRRVGQLSWPPFAADPIKKLVLLDNNIDGFSYADKLNDGLRLLRENKLESLRCAPLDFTNPFSFALKGPPPIGFPVFWQLDYSFSPASYPDERKVFRGLDVILIPKFPEGRRTTEAIEKAYQGYLARNFSLKADSYYWTVLTRK